MLTLSEEDGKLYYQLWLPLLDYVNEQYKVSKELKNIASAKALNPNEVKKVADKLWANPDAIDDYLKMNQDLPEDHKSIISSWKRCLSGRFLMERHLQKGSIFISMDTNEVYQVSGIVSSWEEMFYGAPLPLMVNATFIPFRDTIISDGLVIPYNIFMGPGVRKMAKDTYMEAKKGGRIHRTL